MKNKIFITGLALSILLTGCNFKNNSGVPTKSKYSHEVQYSEFSEKYNAAFDDGAFDNNISFVSNGRIKNKVKANLFDDTGKVIGNGTGDSDYKYNGKYDYKNNVSYVAISGSEQTTINYNGETNKDSDSANYNRIYQKPVVEGQEENPTFSVNRKDKEYYEANGDPATKPVILLLLPVLFYGVGTNEFDKKTDEEKNKWKFYIDGAVFTATYKSTSIKKLTDEVDGQPVNYAEEKNDEFYLVQFKRKDANGKFSSLSCYYEEVANKSTYYLTDYEDDFSFKSGQTLIEETNFSIGFIATAKKVTLNPVDLTGYTLKEKDEESEKFNIFN